MDGIRIEGLDDLEDFVYSVVRLHLDPELSVALPSGTPVKVVKVGVVVLSPKTGEWKVIRARNRQYLSRVADQLHIEALDDFFADFDQLPLRYDPKASIFFSEHPDWLTVASQQLKGAISVSTPMAMLSISLEDGALDLAENLLTNSDKDA